MKRKVALFLAVVMIAVMALPQIVMADSEKENPICLPRCRHLFAVKWDGKNTIPFRFKI